jgi:hypothetical protein
VTSVAVRTVLLFLALLVLGWLIVGLRAVRLEDQAEAVIDRARAGQPVSDAEVRQAQDRLQTARDLSPDLGPMIKEGQLAEALGQRRAADLIARAVAIEEPDNLQAWFLAWAASPDDKSRESSLAQLRRLNPYIEVALGLRDCIDCPLKTR